MNAVFARRLACWGLLTGTLLCLPAQAQAVRLPDVARQLLPVERTRVVVGRTGAVPVRRLLGRGLLRARAFSVDPSVLSVEEDLVFLAGHDLAFVRFKALRRGIGAIRIQGPVDPLRIDVRVVSAGVGVQAALRSVFPGMCFAPGDRFVAEGWGPNAVRELSVFVDGKLVRRVAGREELVGAFPAGLSAGRHVMRVVARDACGFEAADERNVRSLPAGAVPMVFQAEKGERRLPAPGYRFRPAPLGKGSGASGGAYRSLFNSLQEIVLETRVPHSGAYQIRVRARADVAGDYPILAVYRSHDAERPERYDVVATGGFAMHPIGPPLFLEQGLHELHLRFVNDTFQGRGADRNVHVDYLVLTRVADGPLDDDPPRLAVVAPVDGLRFTGSLALKARAADPSGIRSIRVLMGEREVARVERDVLQERMELGRVGPGHHVLRIIAEDTHGNRTEVSRQVECLPYVGQRPRSVTVSAVWAKCARGHEPVRDPEAPTGWRHSQYREGTPVEFTVQAPARERYRVQLIARGDEFRGWPTARVTIDGNRTFDVVIDSDTWKHHPVTTLELAAGKHHITVAFVNDVADAASGGDRNLHVACLKLREQSVDQEPPQIVLLRVPRVICGPDLVIAQVSDNEEVSNVRLLVDGQETGAADRVPPHGLWLRGDLLAPGKHDLQVVARDSSGNQCSSESIAFQVRQAMPEDPPDTFERALLLVDRLGYGGGRSELEKILLLGERAWLARQLAPGPFPTAGVEEAAMSALRSGRAISRNIVRRLFLQRLFRSRRPARERLAAFFDNHFSTWIGKTKGRNEILEWRAFQRAATTTFRELLGVSATSGAMLNYLDNQDNRRGSPNENYARELMELHTLGVHGGYTQADVVGLARIFTGWRAEPAALRFRFAFSRALHDPGPKRALGAAWKSREQVGEGERVLDMLAAHPSTALFVCRRLATHYVQDDPPAALVASMARTFLETGGDLPAVMRSMLEGPWFFRRARIGARVRDPLALAVSTWRCGAEYAPEIAVRFLARCDRLPFECVPPTGYPDRSESWVDSQGLLARWNFAADVTPAGVRALAVLPGSRGPAELRRAVEFTALNVMGRLPPARETRAAVVALRSEPGRLRASAVLETVLRLPSSLRH